MRFVIELAGENPDDEKWEGVVTLDATDATDAITKIQGDLATTCMVVTSVNLWEDDGDEEEVASN